MEIENMIEKNELFSSFVVYLVIMQNFVIIKSLIFRPNDGIILRPKMAFVEGCVCNKVPIMVSFHNLSGSLSSFKLTEADKNATLESLLVEEGPENWTPQDNIQVKVSSSRSGGYDIFSLTNTINLISRVLKTDVIWIIFEKFSMPSQNLPTKNAFDVLKCASKSKGLPDQILNPFTQKQELFNKILDLLAKQCVAFFKSDCAPRLKNRKTGAATELVYEITDIIWRTGQAEKQLKSSALWGKVPDLIGELATFEQKSKEPVKISQISSKAFATHIRETASKALMASPNLAGLKFSLLECAEIFVKYSDYLKKHAESFQFKTVKGRSISTAAEAIILQVNSREKVSLIEAGSKPLINPTLINIFEQLGEPYEPLNISTLLPTNRFSRSTILHRDLPNQTPRKLVLWTFDNSAVAPQSIFAFLVDPMDSQQTILNKTQELKSRLQSMQKFYFPREFYQQFYDQIGSVTGISPQNLKLVSSMVMGDDRRFDGEVQRRFEEAVMSGDPDFVYDMRFFNGREIKYKEYLYEFRKAVEEYMVEDRGRHESQYNGTIISKVSFGFSIKQMFKKVCEKVRETNPDCPLPTSESMITRYLIPRTRAAAESACKSEPLIPLKLSMQQKVIEKPNIDAHYNAAQFKYLKSFATEFGPDLVCMVGWDDKTGVDVGEPTQPTIATQHARKSWVHQERPVGEGQHSFHKTNLTPSVRLVHKIGNSVDESFYRGLPQVVIKDSIFQPSSSARHVTELFQMIQKNPQLLKPVLILTNDGGSDHTIRYERNIVAMLALFLRIPETLVLINFQMAAYRSAYHPVEKLNCILNLAWNGVSLSREAFDDPVLENAFAHCNSMAEVRTKAETHPGIKQALTKSLEPSIKILEERAKQASLKENEFEIFKPASDHEIKEFLSVLVEVDPDFDVDRFLDKKKPYHYSLVMKAYLEDHVTFTHYSLTFMRDSPLSKEFLLEKFPDKCWPAGLEPVPCPVQDKDNPDRYMSYENVKSLAVKDYSDLCRPGAAAKVSSNIPFVKSKQRAFYGSEIPITCEICNKSRVAYIMRKPSSSDIKSAKAALLNVRYICGGRISSFGRSLSVLEEIADTNGIGIPMLELSDEIENESFDVLATGAEVNIANDLQDVVDLTVKPVRKKKKIMIIESDQSENEAEDIFDILANPEQVLQVQEENLEDADDAYQDNTSETCFFCADRETGHKCRSCRVSCCNLCNTAVVDEITDIVCPNCHLKELNHEEPLPKAQKRGRGKPRKKVSTGQILIPLAKKGRGRPRNEISQADSDLEDANDNTEVTGLEEVNNNDESSDSELFNSPLTELRIIGSGNVLKKIFVDETLVCESPIEAHMFDILLSQKKPLPCHYCGEIEEEMMFSKLTEECFPLCKSCEIKGRGAGLRRKSRKIKPNPAKQIKPKLVSKRRKFGKFL